MVCLSGTLGRLISQVDPARRNADSSKALERCSLTTTEPGTKERASYPRRRTGGRGRGSRRGPMHFDITRHPLHASSAPYSNSKTFKGVLGIMVVGTIVPSRTHISAKAQASLQANNICIIAQDLTGSEACPRHRGAEGACEVVGLVVAPSKDDVD